MISCFLVAGDNQGQIVNSQVPSIHHINEQMVIDVHNAVVTFGGSVITVTGPRPFPPNLLSERFVLSLTRSNLSASTLTVPFSIFPHHRRTDGDRPHQHCQVLWRAARLPSSRSIRRRASEIRPPTPRPAALQLGHRWHLASKSMRRRRFRRLEQWFEQRDENSGFQGARLAAVRLGTWSTPYRAFSTPVLRW